MAEVVYFSDPDKGRKRSRISNKDKKKLRGDVAELFTLTDTAANTGSDVSSQVKTWDKSDLTATYHEVAMLADTLTQQQKAKEKVPSKQWIRYQKRCCKVLSYPEVQQQQREKKEKEREQREEQRFSGQVITKSNKKEDSKKSRVAKVGGRWKDSIKGLDPPVGKFKNGVLSLNQKDVKRISKR